MTHNWISPAFAANLSRPLVFFDLEATGLDLACDRIVQFGAIRYNTDKTSDIWPNQLINPKMTMCDEVISVHGITNEAVANCPTFDEIADALMDFISGADFAGFNLLNFDVPLLWEEFHRAKREWDLAGANIVDVGNIFKKQEQRTLTAAVKFYCGAEHEGAHGAFEDATATAGVLQGQLERYPDIPRATIAELAQFSHMEKRLDLAGKIILDKDGDPAYGFGKAKGVKVHHDPGFGHWMLGKDFSVQTKRVLREILDNLEVGL